MFKKIAFFLFMIIATGTAVAQTAEQEASLKAVFIYNFTRYIDWGNITGEPDFVIAVVGSSPMERSIVEIAKTNTVGGKHIVIRHFNKPEEIGFCNILFIPKDCPFALGNILDRIARGVVTISEKPGWGRLGTAFNFVLQHDKLKFEANLKAIEDAGVKVSSQLLKLANIVN